MSKPATVMVGDMHGEWPELRVTGCGGTVDVNTMVGVVAVLTTSSLPRIEGIGIYEPRVAAHGPNGGLSTSWQPWAPAARLPGVELRVRRERRSPCRPRLCPRVW